MGKQVRALPSLRKLFRRLVGRAYQLQAQSYEEAGKCALIPYPLSPIPYPLSLLLLSNFPIPPHKETAISPLSAYIDRHEWKEHFGYS